MSFFPDSQTLLQIGNISVRWYAVLIISGATIAYYLMGRDFKKNGYDSEIVDDLFIGALFFGVIGARIWYVLFSDVSYYLSDPIKIFQVWNGGLAIHGGLVGGGLYCLIYLKKRKSSFLRAADCILPYVLIAQAVGRWGNFLNQEAFGQAVEESYFNHFPAFIKNMMFIDGSYREPMFLYESILCILGFVLIMVYRKYSNPKRGDLSYCYVLWYGAIRFWIEAKRSDSLMFLGLKMAQITSVIGILIGLLGLLGVYRKFFKQAKPIILFDNDGTLVDTKAAIQASFKKVMKEELNVDMTLEELEAVIGPSLQQTFSKYCDNPDRIPELMDKYREHNKVLLESIQTMPYAKEVLEQLKQEGYKLGIVSVKKEEALMQGLKVGGIENMFDVIVAGDMVTNPKPDKEGILKACHLAKACRDDAIYVGDAKADVLAGHNAGVYSIGYCIPENIQRTKELEEVKPNSLIHDLRDILEIVKEEDHSWSNTLR